MSGLPDIAGKIKAAGEALLKANAELKWEMAATAADVAGMVDPTPVSDLVGAGLSLRKGDFWGAGLSVASMIPYAGDALAKPVKGVRAAKAIMALEKKIAKLTAELNDLKKQAKAAETAAREAKIASEAAAKAKAAKEAAQRQQAAAKGNKGKDCEDCGKPGKAALKPMPLKRVQCFSGKNLPKAKQKEFAEQLARQEAALNKLSVKEFADARAHFDKHKRHGTGTAQKKARAEYAEALIAQRTRENLARKIPAREAERLAEESTAATMQSLAALHEPDMIAGGKDVVTAMGDRNVNSSIGGQWKSRVKELDEAIGKIPESEHGKTQMNVKLPKCK